MTALTKHPISVSHAGVHSRHELEYTIDRPHGLGQFLFLHFRSPVQIRTGSRTTTGRPHDCIIFTPEHRQWYRGHGVGLCDDYMHFSGPDCLTLIRYYELPLNALFRPGHSGFVAPLINEILHAKYKRDLFWEDEVTEHMSRLMRLLATHWHLMRQSRLTPVEATYLERFQQLRVTVHEQLQRSWTVADMAKDVHLSTSRFTALYKRFFHVSPLKDLLNARLELAKYFLTCTSLSVKEVAFKAGFGNAYYFSRIFRRRSGCAPSKYYRRELDRLRAQS